MTTPNNNKKGLDVVKSVAWLIEAGFRGFAGYAMLTHLHNYVVVAAGIYSLATATIIVVMHFVKAHK